MPLPPEVWYAIPSANPEMARRTLPVWKEMGYKVAVLLERDAASTPYWAAGVDVVALPFDTYHGYPASVDHLLRHAVPRDVRVVVTGGDDMYPDRHRPAGEIAREFLGRFPDTFGVMQPTGDTLDGTDRICGSPWLGRAFFERVNLGRGPFWPGYFAFWSDEELFNVSKLLGVLWQRPDLCQYHDHWSRRGVPQPPHIQSSQDAWARDRNLFRGRKAEGFPGHEPLPASQPPTQPALTPVWDASYGGKA